MASGNNPLTYVGVDGIKIALVCPGCGQIPQPALSVTLGLEAVLHYVLQLKVEPNLSLPRLLSVDVI